VSFVEVKAGDSAPYCINIPVRREEERPAVTLLEERLHGQQHQDRIATQTKRRERQRKCDTCRGSTRDFGPREKKPYRAPPRPSGKKSHVILQKN